MNLKPPDSMKKPVNSYERSVSGIDPAHLISAIRGIQPDTEFLQLTSAWYRFKIAMWDVFSQSKVGKFMFWIADKLEAFLERFGK